MVDRLVCCIEYASYDGVDLKLHTTSRVATGSTGESVQVDASLGRFAQEGVVVPQGEAAPMPVALDSTVGKAKVLNHELGIAMLLELGGKLVLLSGEVLTPLQAVDHNTVEAIWAALRASDFGTPAREAFARRLRVVTTDAASCNFRAERGLMDGRAGWSHLHFRCQVHVVSGVHRLVYDLLHAEV